MNNQTKSKRKYRVCDKCGGKMYAIEGEGYNEIQGYFYIKGECVWECQKCGEEEVDDTPEPEERELEGYWDC